MAWIDGQEVTVSVTLANFAATGKPAISGTAQVGETLTAAIGNIADTDGLPTTFPGDYTFEWLRRDGGTDSPITGATASTYTPVAADVGKKIKVKVDFTDDESNPETLTSNAFPSSGTIVSETPPVLSFAPNIVTVSEDAVSATLTVELDPASTGTVTVDYATRDGIGTAKAGEDYTATSGTLTFAATETSKTITVPILNDDAYENNESFHVDLTNPSGATLSDSAATVSIDSEEAVPTASMEDVTVDEGARTMTLTLRLSHPSQPDIAYLTIDVTGTATEGDDYDDFLLESGRSARITVPGGSLSQTFDITIVDDGVDEPDETIDIIWRKGSTSDVTPGTINFIGTITDNDTAPVLVRFGASSYTAAEGGAAATVTVELSEAMGSSTTIPLTPTNRGGATDADYTGVPPNVTFGASQTSTTFTVTAVDDSDDDDDESVRIGFGPLPSGVEAGSPATATVALDDNDGWQPPTVSFGAATYTATEGGGESLAIGFGSPLPSGLRIGSPSRATVRLVDNDVPEVPGKLRLAQRGGVYGGSYGRLQVYHDGQWGLVCEGNFGREEARVACRQLGFADGEEGYGGAGSGGLPFWLKGVQCDGTESRLVDCGHRGLKEHYCGSFDITGVECSRTLLSMADARVDGPLLTVRYNAALDGGSRPSAGDFVVLAGSAGGASAVPVTSVSVDGDGVALALARPVLPDETLRLSYLDAPMHPLRDLSGTAAAAQTDMAVRNETRASGMGPPRMAGEAWESARARSSRRPHLDFTLCMG